MSGNGSSNNGAPKDSAKSTLSQEEVLKLFNDIIQDKRIEAAAALSPAPNDEAAASIKDTGGRLLELKEHIKIPVTDPNNLVDDAYFSNKQFLSKDEFNMWAKNLYQVLNTDISEALHVNLGAPPTPTQPVLPVTPVVSGSQPVSLDVTPPSSDLPPISPPVLRAANANQSSQTNSAQQNNATPPVRTASTAQQQSERKTPQQLMEHISELNKKIDHTKKVLEQYDAGIKKFIDEKGFKKDAKKLIDSNNDLVKPLKDITDQKKINQRKTEIFALLGTRNHLLKQEPPNTTLIDQNTKSLCEGKGFSKDDLDDRDDLWKKVIANEKETAKQKIEIKDPNDSTKVIALNQQEANKLRMELAKLEEEKELSSKQAARQTGEREPVQNSARCIDPNPEPFDFTATKDVLKEFKSSYPKDYPCKEDASLGAVKFTSTTPPPPPTHTTTVTKDGVSTTSTDKEVLRQNARLYLQLAKENGRGVTDDDVKISGKNAEMLREIFRDERKKMELEEQQASIKDANHSQDATFKSASDPSTPTADGKKAPTPPVKGQVGNSEDKKDKKDKDADTDKENDAGDKPKTPRPGG